MTVYSAKDNTAQLVKDAAQLADIIGECVTLKRSGTNLKGLCPFHAEKTPSFMVNPERQTFHCFGCGEGGDVFTFVMKYHRLTFPEALKELAGRYHIPLPQHAPAHADSGRAQQRDALFAANEQAAAIYHDFLVKAPGAEKARAYLQERGVPPAAIADFRLGYGPAAWDFLKNKLTQAGIAPALGEEAGLLVKKEQGGYYDRFRDRILFPIIDGSGRVAGFGGRVLGDGQPKYLNTPQTPVFDKGRLLLGLFQHRQNIRRANKCVIVEGNFDLLSLAIKGVDYAVAPLGTALTAAQIRTLKGYAETIILLFDGDAAGLKAALRVVPMFFAEQVMARVAVLPAGHDPDTFVRSQGRAGLEKCLDGAQPLAEFVFDRLVDKYGLSLDGKGRIMEELRPLVVTDGITPLQRSVIISHFCTKLNLDQEQVLAGFVQTKTAAPLGPAAGSSGKTRLTPVSLPRQQKQLLEFLIVYPEYLQKFIDSGLEEVLVEPAARLILAALKELCPAGAPKGPVRPERLLDFLAGGPERSFVSELLIGPQTFTGDDNADGPADMAAAMIVWLERNRLVLIKKRLDKEIEQARHARDDERLLALSGRKIEVNTALAALPQGEG